MFCNSCGQALAQGQSFCAKCGQPVGVAVIPSRINRVAEHTKLLGILWIVYSALNLLIGIVMLFVANTILHIHINQNMNGVPPEMPSFLHAILTAVVFFLFAKGAIGVAAGAGLLQHASWGRILALVLGFLSLLNIPFGTALGVYTIWVLLSADADRQYQALAASA